MSTLLDGSIFSLQTRGGISRYTYEIASHMARDSAEELILGLLPGFDKNIFASGLKSLRSVGLPWPVLEPWYFSKRISSYKFRLVHSPYLLLPKRTVNRLNIITIHDLISFESEKSLRTKLKNQIFITAINRADAIIFISHETRRIFYDRFAHLNRDAISTVIYNGVCDLFQPIQERQLIPASISKDREYLLWIGPRAGYKNFLPFLDAYIKSKVRENVRLVLVGGPELNNEELFLLEKVKWTRLETVADKLLMELYSGAVALMYPSAKEGFGLPILEAMSCECPVICFNSGAIKEVSAGNAIYLESLTPEEIDRTVETANGSTRLGTVAKARVHASGFSWKATAASTYNFYRSLG